MKVSKTIAPLTAYFFDATVDGNNLEDLSADVSADGGVVEAIDDNTVSISVEAGTFTLPINSALVIEGGIGKIVYKEQFFLNYTIMYGGTSDMSSIAAVEKRLLKLETKMEQFTKTAGLEWHVGSEKLSELADSAQTNGRSKKSKDKTEPA